SRGPRGRPQDTVGQRTVPDTDRHHRRAPEPGPQHLRGGPRDEGHPAPPGQPYHLLGGARPGIRRDHDAPDLVRLQRAPHGVHADHQLPRAHPQAEQAQEALHQPPASSPPSSISSARNASSSPASASVIPGTRSTSSRSKSRISLRCRNPAPSSSATSSGERPCSSLSGTWVAASSSGGSGAKSGPSPPRSSHSRLE